LIGPEKNAVKSSERQLISGSYEITNLWEGTFKLYTAPFDGVYKFNIVEKDGVKPVNNEKISFMSHFNEKSQLSATWTVGDAQAYSLSGFTRDFDNINIFCGVKIEDGKIYKVENGVVTGEGMSINNGDEVKVVGNDQLQAKVYVQNEFAFDIIHNEYGNLYWAVETADGKTVKNLSLEQISINGWAPVVENVHTQNFVDSEHLSFQEVGLYEEEIVMVCEEGKGINNRGVENLAVQSSTNGTHKVNLVLTLPSEYKDKEVYVVSPSGSSVPVDVDYVKTEDGSDEYQKQLTIPGDGTYVISVKSGAGTVSKQFIVR
jgi:hypothetical protein